jgi:hypothetical protein
MKLNLVIYFGYLYHSSNYTRFNNYISNDIDGVFLNVFLKIYLDKKKY